jgi:outer membrane biosynthesis protein TonB
MKQIFTAVIAAFTLACGAQQDEKGVVVAGTTLRELATFSPTPDYPASSVAAGTEGRSVVSVSYDSKGLPVRVALLEAPDTAIGVSVVSTLGRWKFRPFILPNKRTASRATGRLVFYFGRKEGRSSVSDAASAVIAAERFQRKSPH